MNGPCRYDQATAMVLDQAADRLDWLTTAVLLAWMAVVRVAA
jgi:hypothetical protein